MRCRDAQDGIWLRLAGELDPHDEAELDGHLAGCPDCRDQEGGAREIHAEMDEQISGLGPPGGLLSRIVDSLPDEPVTATSSPGARLRIMAVLGTAAAALILWLFLGSGPETIGGLDRRVGERSPILAMARKSLEGDDPVELERSIRALEGLLESDGDEEIRLLLGLVLARRSHVGEEPGRFVWRGVEVLSEHLDDHPDSIEARMERARLLLSLRRLDEAIEDVFHLERLEADFRRIERSRFESLKQDLEAAPRARSNALGG